MDHLRRALPLLLAAASAAGQPAFADTIRLKDQTSVSGDVVQVDDDDVLIRLPRESIAAVNGEPLPAPLNEGMPAPGFAAKDIAGNVQSVGASKAKVTLLHFWVYWCPHCRSDSAQVQAVYDRHKNDPKVRVITVNLDKRRQKDKVEATIKERHLTFPIIMLSDSPVRSSQDKDVQDLYQITGFPVTFLIDEQGIIRYKRRGSFAESHEDLEAEIENLLKQQG